MGYDRVTSAAVRAAYDEWLGPNGITEWLPEHPIVRAGRRRIAYTAFVYLGERGFTPTMAVLGADHLTTEQQLAAIRAGTRHHHAVIEWRTVPCRVPLTDHTRRLLRGAGIAVIENGPRHHAFRALRYGCGWIVWALAHANPSTVQLPPRAPRY
jgi:hypothetical protein